jgi:hypothetical protein
MTLRPAAFSARALSVTAMVGDGLMRLRWSARKAIGVSRDPGCRAHPRPGGALVMAVLRRRKPQKMIVLSRLLMA